MITGDKPAICTQFIYFEDNVIYQRNPGIIAEKTFFRISNPWVVEKLKINKQKAFLVRYLFSDLRLKLMGYLYETCGTYFKFNVYLNIWCLYGQINNSSIIRRNDADN